MRVMLAGEGPTDLGAMEPTAGGLAFVPGPMATLVDQLMARRLHYSLLDLHRQGVDCIRYVDKSTLKRNATRGPLLLPGFRHGKGTAFFARNAQVLGLMAKEDARQSGDTTLAVLFRDGDGTRSMAAAQWEEKVASMARGFALAEFPCGVAMVPRPKTEAWLMCAFMPQPYQQCAVLEEASGNDASPQSLKARLEKLVGYAPTAQDQSRWVQDGTVEALRIDLPSFLAFRRQLRRALTAAGVPTDPWVDADLEPEDTIDE